MAAAAAPRPVAVPRSNGFNVFPNLAKKVEDQYETAKGSGDLLFFESKTEVVEHGQIPFEVSLCEALNHKPSASDGSSPPSKKAKTDPFGAPYTSLFIAEDVVLNEGGYGESDAFSIFLNKYSVVPRHVIVATKEFVPQTTPLTQSELYVTYAILKQLSAKERHLAFFNCGSSSGASQPHKHLQFLPLPNGRAPIEACLDANRPENLAAPFQLPLPYANFGLHLQPGSNDQLGVYLCGAFLSLLDLMIDHLRQLASRPESNIRNLRLSLLSYNLLLTENWMMLIPRRHERASLAKTVEEGAEPNGSTEDTFPVNALGFAGMLLTKSAAQTDLIKEIGPLNLLERVAFEPMVAQDPTGDAVLA